MPSFPDLPEPLGDGVVALRLYAERDIPDILIAFEQDPLLDVRLGLERPPTGADLGRQAEQAERERRAGLHVALTIVPADCDVCVGRIVTTEVDWYQARIELGVWLAPQVRGRGFAPRAIRLTAQWLLGAARFERVQLTTEPDNEPMLRAARAAGFRDEGVLRGYTFERGARVDCTILSLLAEDLRS